MIEEHSWVWGCCECEFDRLRSWAIKNQLINEVIGPKEMVDRILELTDKMDQEIHRLRASVIRERDIR